MNEAKKAYAKALGLYDWKIRKKNETSITMHSSQEEWQSLQKCVAACTACSLHQSRTQTVFGIGDRKASLMIIGEAPGFYEDQQGEPFVGRAGQLLTAMLKSIGFTREQVYIANILKCRPRKRKYRLLFAGIPNPAPQSNFAPKTCRKTPLFFHV